MIDPQCFEVIFKNGFTIFEGDYTQWLHNEYPSFSISFTPYDFTKERIEISIGGVYTDRYRVEYVLEDCYLFSAYEYKTQWDSDLYKKLSSLFDTIYQWKVFTGKINKFTQRTNPV